MSSDRVHFDSDVPSVRREGACLVVDGERFTVMGAELHNSSSSTPAAIEKSFSRAAELGANTVLAPVAWNLVEEVEGTFDFALVDCMLTVARRLNVRLIPLWFGSWKNGMSTYAPGWVKTDPARFPRAETSSGPIEHLSPFGAEARDADARAFAAFMSHLRHVDQQGTAIMVQVENEVGLLGSTRDRSALAASAWAADVPAHVVDVVAGAPELAVHERWVAAGRRLSGTWAEVFGSSDESDEAFMAYAYASYVGAVAAAGRAEHDVPLFVNAWLDVERDPSSADLTAEIAGGATPGDYPSGGPVTRVAALWHATAPAISFLAPDIYFGDFRAICERYTAASGILFIPEMDRTPTGVAQMMLAVGEFGAAGVAPFGVDSLVRTDPEWTTLADGYNLLRAAARSFRTFPDATSRGFVLDAVRPSILLDFSGFTIRLETSPAGAVAHGPQLGYGFAIEEEPGRVLLAGRGFVAFFGDSTNSKAGILSADELSAVDGESVTRRFNGDEIFSGKFTIFPPHHSPDRASAPTFALASDMTGIVRYTFYRY